jgi:hypothetical protein
MQTLMCGTPCCGAEVIKPALILKFVLFVLARADSCSGSQACPVHAGPKEISTRNHNVIGIAYKLSCNQELVFVNIHRMRLDFDVETTCKANYSFQSAAWIEWSQRIETICQVVALC